MRAGDGRADVLDRRFSGFAAIFRLAASTQTGFAELDDAVRMAAFQSLRIGIGRDEFHTLHAIGDHVLDRVAAAAAHADHLDLGALVERVAFIHFDGHCLLLSLSRQN